MTQLETDGRFAESIRLFNQRNFFEAHEAWEQAWKVAEGIEKIFYQGIIHEIAFLSSLITRLIVPLFSSTDMGVLPYF
jgi:predicted metal-dependent hydrolase